MQVGKLAPSANNHSTLGVILLGINHAETVICLRVIGIQRDGALDALLPESSLLLAVSTARFRKAMECLGRSEGRAENVDGKIEVPLACRQIPRLSRVGHCAWIVGTKWRAR